MRILLKSNWSEQLRLWCVIFALGGLVPPSSAREEEVRNPHTTSVDVTIGASLFRGHCAFCHGLAGGGGRGPNLTLGEFYHGSSDAELLHTVQKGLQGTEMPGSWLKTQSLWRMIAYVRSLSEDSRPTKLPGNPKDGRELFRGRGACLQCHLVQGQGGRLGPDLTNIGSRLNPESLKVSIFRPNEVVNPEYWSFRVTEKSGTILQGIRLNEGPYSLQMMDMNENLHSLWKRNLKVHMTKTSWMPSYEDVFNQDEVDDIIAYLYSLRRKPRIK